MVSFKVGKYLIRPFKKGDEESLRISINDKDIYRTTLTVPYPYTKKDAQEWVSYNLKKPKNEINWAITDANKVIGGIALSELKTHKAELGYWLSKEYRGQGIMTKSVRIITKYGLNNLKLARIYANVYKFNKKSARVLEKNNYKLEGLLKNNVYKDKKVIDSLMYAKTRRA